MKLGKWTLALKIMPLLVLVIATKLLIHTIGWEAISLNALFTSIVAGAVFLIGFLISGVLSDYKESEKIPGELAASLEAIYDESYIVYKNKHAKAAKEFLNFQVGFTHSVMDWFYKKEKTRTILDKISRMNDYFLEFESLTQANFITRMKQEQNNVRKMIIRVHTIRETNFVTSAYTIVEILSTLLIIGLVFLKLEPFYESMFVVFVVSFLILYMIFLIKDLDNPFDHSTRGEAGSEVSLKPLHDFEERLKENVKKLKL